MSNDFFFIFNTKLFFLLKVLCAASLKFPAVLLICTVRQPHTPLYTALDIKWHFLILSRELFMCTVHMCLPPSACLNRAVWTKSLITVNETNMWWIIDMGAIKNCSDHRRGRGREDEFTVVLVRFLSFICSKEAADDFHAPSASCLVNVTKDAAVARR